MTLALFCLQYATDGLLINVSDTKAENQKTCVVLELKVSEN